jgi:carbonic anhydrase
MTQPESRANAATPAKAGIKRLDGKRRGLVDHWLHPIREVADDHEAELAAYADEQQRLNRLCELSVPMSTEHKPAGLESL